LVDVRGIGGLVIAAGSYSTAQGRPYARVSSPGLLPQPLPGWLLKMLRAAGPAPPSPAPIRPVILAAGRSRDDKAAGGALNYCVRQLSTMAPESGRNKKLFSAARWLGEQSAGSPTVLTESAVRTELLGAALACGLKERAALNTIASGWKAGLTKPAQPFGGAA
jgi:hypothetical protein